MPVYDISLPLHAALAVWPGDTPVDFRLSWRMDQGEPVNVGALTASVHAGTHTDAPFHYDAEGATVDRLDLYAFLGPAVVVDARGRETIQVEDIAGAGSLPAPRVLLRTDAWPDPTRFPERIPVMSVDVPGFLASQGVILVGVDVPSVDALDSKELPNHHALGQAGIHILESLRLADIAPGEYELIALPLRLAGADGSPVRAVLRR